MRLPKGSLSSTASFFSPSVLSYGRTVPVKDQWVDAALSRVEATHPYFQESVVLVKRLGRRDLL
jgi:hypothetical protein